MNIFQNIILKEYITSERDQTIECVINELYGLTKEEVVIVEE